jgi:hypothetical protein
MSRRLLPLAMLASLWPVGFIAVSIATASKHRGGKAESVEVKIPSTTRTPAAAPKTATIRLKSGGKTYECPAGTRDKLSPIDQRAGAAQLQLSSVRGDLRRTTRRLKELDKLYPGHTAPTQALVNEYNGLLRKGRRLEARESRLVRAYNDTADAHNHVLQTDCT